VLSGHPLDTVKVRLQTQTSNVYSGAIDCLTKTVKDEGFKGLYKGVQSPLVGVAALNAVMFLAYGQAKTFIQTDPKVPLTLPQYFLAGTFAGVCISFVESPVDLFKSQMQVQYGAGQKYKNITDCARQIIGQHGIRGAYQGLGATFVRDVPSNGCYFFCYELARRLLTKPGQRVEELPSWKVMIAGGFGGMCYWAGIYPADVVKSTLQTDNIDPSKRKYSGVMDCARKIYASQGVKGFFKGFTPCIIRSIPANAACFAVYEQARKFMG